MASSNQGSAAAARRINAPESALENSLEKIREGVVTFDHAWRYTYVNRAAAELIGPPAEALLGSTVWEIFPELVGSLFYTELHLAAANRQHRNFEQHFPTTSRWLEADAYPTNDGLIVIVRDVSDQKRGAQKLQSKLRQLELLFELSGAVSRAQNPSEIYRAAVQGLVAAVAADRAAVLIFDPDEVLRFKAWIDLSEEYRAAVEGHTPWRRGVRDAQTIAISDILRDPCLADYREVLSKEGIRAVAFIPLMGNVGLIGKFMLYYNAPHEFDTEEMHLAQTIAAHVAFAAERIQAEASLRDSERRLKLAQSAAHLGICEWDLTANTMKYSREYVQLYGLPPDHPLTREEVRQMIHPDDRARVQAGIREALDRAHAWHTEYRVVWPDGSVHWLLSKGAVSLDDSGRPSRSTGVILDITEGKIAEAAVRESEERFRTLADTAPVMICVSGPDKLATFFNQGWLNFTGRALEQELGYGWTASVHPEDLERCLASYSSSFDARAVCHIEYRLRRADGEYRSIVCNGVPYSRPNGVFAGYIATCVDFTDLKRAQEETFERQKLESLGVLTQGIAHDFNNLLGSILAEAELAETELAVDSSPAEEIQRIKAVAIRASEIVRELMIYSGQDSASLEAVNVSGLVEEMLELLKVSIPKRVSLRADLPKNLPAVLGNAPQIRQIVMNLIINASEAIGQKDGGIYVTTARVTGNQNLAPNGPANLQEGEYLRLEVSDTGGGVTAEVKAKIFDPFFTTKFTGRGLGLAVVQGLVRAHSGAINIVSTQDLTKFQIFLPCMDQPADQNRLPIAASTVWNPDNNAAALLPGRRGYAPPFRLKNPV